MNVAFVVHYYDSAEGTGGYVTELLPRVAHEHRVTLYAAGVKAPVPDGVEVVHVPALRGRAYSTILSFPLAYRAVRRKHDIVHAQGWVVPEADVVTAHIVMAGWRKAVRDAGGATGIGERIFGGLVTRREAALFRNRARTAIVPSRKARDELAQFYGRTEHVYVIPHGFPPVTAARDRTAVRTVLKLPRDVFAALFVGDPRKGLPAALNAVAASKNAHLFVVSRSPRDHYMHLALEVGVAERVHWIGGLEDVAPAYAAADVLLHPTIYDSFGLVVAEAMAAGVPPIISRSAGITELIEDRESGWLVNDGDIGEMSSALDTLAGDQQLLRALADGARRAAGTRTWDAVARDTLDLYERVRRL
ncbi:MAG: glycosyltransferase family 4 protein [Gemmatimonadales bacterium]